MIAVAENFNIESLVNEVLQRITMKETPEIEAKPRKTQCVSGIGGVFADMEQAIKAACISQQKLSQLCIERRKIIINSMREAVLANAQEIARLSVEETGLGRLQHKVKKNILAAQKTPGVEDIATQVFTGDNGLTLVEHAPYGVIGAITPSTNPSETVICNGIGMIAAGNSVVFNSHPGAKRVTQYTIQLLNSAIVEAGGPENLLCVVAEPTLDSSRALMSHPAIRLLVVTGGPEIVRLAMNSGKKVIAAGPGNPPVVVDETADIEQAARDIADGAAFDNNVLCIAEKEVFVVDLVAEHLMSSMEYNGAYKLPVRQLDELMEKIAVKNNAGQLVPNKKFVGKDVRVILREIGIDVSEDIKLVFSEVPSNHPLVNMEQLMPVLPIVRVKNVDEAIEQAYKAEQGNFHTAMMHSTNIDNLSKMAKKMNTSIFVKNGPSYSGLGMLGEGFATFTIASPTGEGLTSPISFTRQRRCVLKDRLRII